MELPVANLDDLYSEIPTQQIARKLGVDAGEVDSAIKTLVPVLVGSLHQNAQDGDAATKIESAASNHAASGLLDGGVTVDDVDEKEDNQEISRIFGGSGGGGNNPLGSILGSVLGGNQGNAIGEVLGGLLGGKK